MKDDGLKSIIEDLRRVSLKIKELTNYQGSEIIIGFASIINFIQSVFGNLENFIKFASNYQELETDKYTFLEMVEWFRENKPEGNYIGAVLRSKEKTEKGEYIYKLDHVYLEAAKNTPCMIECPYRVVKTFYLDKELNDIFGDKNLLILK